MQGEDVRSLQIMLNRDMQTQVSSTGPGSPSQETTYFGPKTAAAVVKFQEKYREIILKPNGLNAGTGIVGLNTMTVLNQQARDQITSSTAQPSVVQSVQSAENPNLKNLDKFFTAIDSASQKRGLSPTKIASLKDEIKKEILATTTDLQAEFFKQASQQHASSLFPAYAYWNNFRTKLKNALSLVPSHAEAQTDNTRPFGGQVYFYYYCACTSNWLLTIQPLAPDYVALLTYTMGTQGYLNYNIPITLYLVGKYEQGGQCQIYVGEGCTEIPQEGKINRTTGSSPI
jgi:hypothetical protein